MLLDALCSRFAAGTGSLRLRSLHKVTELTVIGDAAGTGVA